MDKELLFELAKKWEDEAAYVKTQHDYETHYALSQAANELRMVINGELGFINKWYEQAAGDDKTTYNYNDV